MYHGVVGLAVHTEEGKKRHGMHRGGNVFTFHTGSISNSMQGREIRSSEGGSCRADFHPVLVDSLDWDRGTACFRGGDGLGIDSAPYIV